MKAQATLPRRTRTGNPEAGRSPWVARALIVVMLVAVTAALALAYRELTSPGSLPLRVIEIKGEFRHLDAAAIERTVSAAIDGGFFTCDLPRLRAAVLAMPWVEEVSIRRIWPDRLRMQVSEQIPLARWGDDALVNVHAHVFRPPSIDEYAGLVRLSGPDGSERRVVEFLQAGLAPARARGLAIREVRLDERRHWSLVFDDGLTLSLGRENPARRLDDFYRVYPGLVAYRGQPPVRVDMRYANGLAVRWAEPDNPAPADGKPGEKV